MTQEQDTQKKEILTGAHRDYEKGLIIHAFFKIRDRAIGEDLVQDTFMKTWLYLIKGGKIDTMKAFLYHILNHLIIDEYRRHKPISLDLLMEKGVGPSTDNSARIFNILDGKAAILLIQGLPEKYRTIMHMRFVQNLSLKEISLITGRSKNTVAVQIHRGLEKLKVLYAYNSA